ncbi:MAG TPA: ABC transporter substrate-binding protein [Negativicutes bacterium]|nr:ABC transporter substrate-binding protein [Negativicutes bacterium]
MRKKLNVVLFLLCCLLLGGCAGKETAGPPADTAENTRTIVDMAGRSVTIPAQVNKVYGASPTGTILLYTIDPDLLVGWNYFMGMDGSQFVAEKYKNLPVLGGWFGNISTANTEDLIRLHPDLILTMDSPKKPELADRIQDLTGIPVVVVDGSIDKMEEAYRFAGKVLGREERTAALADYCRETVALVRERKPQLAGRSPVRVYYAEGSRGLETEPAGSWHAELIEYVGGVNVAGTGLPPGGELGRSPVSAEQVLLWNPEVVLIGYFRAGETSSYAQIMTDGDWADIAAVRHKRVYEIPTQPFNWFDRPPCINRLIGIRWVANLLYPEVFQLDMRAEVKRFYQLFYHYTLSDREVDALLQHTQ